MSIAFHWIDVFAERPLTGNPLALVPTADHLDDVTMRAIAQEFNQSETTFIVRSERGADHRLRSFTPGGVEVGGAGHNAIGAWIWLADSGLLPRPTGTYRQEIGNTILEVRLDHDPAGRLRVSMDQSEARFLIAAPADDALAAALGLLPERLEPSSPAEVVSTGAEHLLVRAVSADAVDAAQVDQEALGGLLAARGGEGCYLYAIGEPFDAVHAYARFFNPTVGIVEDPATGTAAGPLAALLVRDGLAADGETIVIQQGVRLGRPSLLELTVNGARVTISGGGLVVASGTLTI